MADLLFSEALRAQGADEAAAILRASCEPLPSPDAAEDFGRPFDRFADAKVVLLGEATHGTSQFYKARAAITRRLIEKHGFNIVAVEADWPDAARIDRHVRLKAHEPSPEEAFSRFPVWMWRNVEVHDFLEWLRAHNEKLPVEARTEFRGLDIYSLGSSIAAVLAYLDRVDPEEAKAARGRYGCLTPWQDDPSRYGEAALRLGKSPCEEGVVAELRALLESRLAYVRRDGQSFFDAAQNARVVRAAEHYYRLMYRSSTESWNLRDRHMFDTLTRLLSARGGDAKAVVWAHNSHIGNAAATAMGWQGEFNIGESCRSAFGDSAALIGFGTDRGTVAAASDWDGPMEVKTIIPARPDSHERVFRQTFVERSLTDWRAGDKSELREILSKPRLERAIGVVYRPETELSSHYFQAVLADQFDAYVWFEQTSAVTPLAGGRPHGAPDTYPFGL
ncbi:erythromycin esterase family protein [Methylocapsa polymorpha]|uniref:Erythromycin esterase family protein n=1 Tax=Methylocapsa polymorpha TaxID=3080828 RepID=A0ABZ0HQZ9_9HYPH|nr:erythromycin esterase family protein [Methylocapsa sp. RX1]